MKARTNGEKKQQTQSLVVEPLPQHPNWTAKWQNWGEGLKLCVGFGGHSF